MNKHKKCPTFRKLCTCLARDKTKFFVCCGDQCSTCKGWLTEAQACQHPILRNGTCVNCGETP